LTIRPLAVFHVVAYRDLMLEAYAAHPDAFTSSAVERAALPLAWWERRLGADSGGAEVVMGAFDGAALAGVAGLSFEPREKARHKATLFGMYVPDARRQQGIGRSLVLAALAQARARPGMRVVQLTVTEGNVAAEALYEQCGFVRFGIEPFAIAVAGRFLSKVHMWCDLEELPLAR